MTEKTLIQKICDSCCSMEELKEFVLAIDRQEYDTENAFGKYYSLDRIIRAIEKYQNNEISADYLAYWANAYDWIIMGGFKADSDSSEVTFGELIVWEISEWLDGLSFFDEVSLDFYDLEKYKRAFSDLDRIMKNENAWNAVHTVGRRWNDEEVEVLAVNAKDREWFLLSDLGEYVGLVSEIAQVSTERFEQMIGAYKKDALRKLISEDEI